jgi:hypothetical protein
MSFDQLYFGLPVAGILIGNGFLSTLIICLIICPGIPFLLGAVIDGYWVPWRSDVQFYAFLPGNLFLALFIACTSMTYQTEGFRINPWVNAVVFFGAFAFYIFLNVEDAKSRYTKGQLKSAMKIYHNSLYFWYGYLAIVCCIAMWASSAPLIIKVLLMLPGIAWLLCMVFDARKSKEIQIQRSTFAHVESLPIWRNGWRIRRLRRTASGKPFKYV